MTRQVNVAVIYYSSTGNVHKLAEAAAEGAGKAGVATEVRLRRVAELAPAEAVALNEQWVLHTEETRHIPEATLEDLSWADAVLFGTPSRYGNPASQLKQFLDSTSGLWAEGKLADKVYSGFTSASTQHGGHESTLLALGIVFHHWGGIIVPPGYTDAIQFEHGNPYGTSHNSANGAPGQAELDTVRYQGQRAVKIAAQLKDGRAASRTTA